MPRRRRRGRPHWFGWLILVLLGLALFLGWQVVGSSAFFKVTSVEVRGDPKNLVAEQIYQATRGKSLVFFPATEVGKTLAQNLLVSRVDFDRVFPGKLIATVHYRQAVLSWQSSQGRYLVDREGVAYAPAGSEPVPQASDPDSNLALGERLSPTQVGTTLAVLKALGDSFTVLTLSLKDQGATIRLSNGTQVSLDASGDLKSEISALQLILTQAKIEGRLPKTIDLRFTKPVVTF